MRKFNFFLFTKVFMPVCSGRRLLLLSDDCVTTLEFHSLIATGKICVSD